LDLGLLLLFDVCVVVVVAFSDVADVRYIVSLAHYMAKGHLNLYPQHRQNNPSHFINIMLDNEMIGIDIKGLDQDTDTGQGS
jgi:hypothetical protein